MFKKKKLYTLKGFWKLKKQNQLKKIMQSKEVIFQLKFFIGKKVSEDLFGSASAIAADVVKDFVISRFGHKNLNESLLSSIGNNRAKICHPLPSVWRSGLRKLGWPVSELKSAIIWRLTIFFYWGYGLFVFLKYLSGGILNTLVPSKKCNSNFVYFHNLGHKHYLPTRKNKKIYNVITWYLRWKHKEKKINEIHHNIKNEKTFFYQKIKIRKKNPISCPNQIISVVNFICWGFKAILPCISGLFGKKWWHPLLFSSFVESYLIRNQKELAKNYFFHNGGRYRPLWTYETEKRGARNTYYFLSTNNAAFKEKNGKTSPLPYKKFMLWNDYLVWDKVQKKAVKSNIQNKAIENKAKIRIVGPISLLDSGSEIPNFSKPAVAVFDIPARKPRIFASFASPTNYYTSNIVNKFLSDIQNVTENEKWMMIWKGKKTSENLKDKNLDPIYTSYLAKLQLHKNVVLLDPNIAAERIIKKVLLVISIPFTSTALIGSYLKKPSIYYDPMFFCKKNDEAAHGIKIIQGKNELQNYLKTLRD